MTTEVANALFGYFELLYDLNRNIIKLCASESIFDMGQYTRISHDTIQAIPKLISYNSEKNKLILSKNEGLLCFSKTIPFINDDYRNLFNNNISFLSDIKILRNKLEHNMHVVKLVASSQGSFELFTIDYSINNKPFKLSAFDFIKFVKGINCIFSKIQFAVSRFVEMNNKENYWYYRRLTSFDFQEFNTFYDSQLLRSIGHILYDF